MASFSAGYVNYGEKQVKSRRADVLRGWLPRKCSSAVFARFRVEHAKSLSTMYDKVWSSISPANISQLHCASLLSCFTFPTRKENITYISEYAFLFLTINTVSEDSICNDYSWLST